MEEENPIEDSLKDLSKIEKEGSDRFVKSENLTERGQLVSIIALVVILLLFAVGIVFIINKGFQNKNTKSISTTETSLIFDNKQVQIITYDGCQYLYLGTDKGIIFTHKGNCVNKTHYNHVRDMIRKIPAELYYDLKMNDSSVNKIKK